MPVRGSHRPGTVGEVLGLGTLAGIVGAGVSVWLGGRVRVPIALIATSLGSGACYVLLARAHGPIAYTVTFCVWGIVFCPIVPYAYAFATQIDPSGSLVRLMMSAFAITTAIGPVFGAQIAERLGYGSTAMFGFAGTLVACIGFALPRQAETAIRVVTCAVRHGEIARRRVRPRATC